MTKYIITNKSTNQIICKNKSSGSRHYRRCIQSYGKEEGFYVLQTTKGRAEKERNHLNKEYCCGWEIEKVEPIVFIDNNNIHNEYLTGYKTLRQSEIEQVRKETAKEICDKIIADKSMLEPIKNEWKKWFNKEYGVEIDNR